MKTLPDHGIDRLMSASISISCWIVTGGGLYRANRRILKPPYPPSSKPPQQGAGPPLPAGTGLTHPDRLPWWSDAPALRPEPTVSPIPENSPEDNRKGTTTAVPVVAPQRRHSARRPENCS